MKLLVIVILSLLSLSSFATDFTCSAKVLEEGKSYSVIDIDAYWRSSTSYENVTLSLPDSYKESVFIDLDIDSRVPNEPKITFKVKKSAGKKVTKTFIIKKFGKSKKFKLDKKHSLEFTCS